MNYSMRRTDRAVTDAEAVLLLDTAEYGFLSTVGADGVPYGIPVNFVRDGNTLILHCAAEGRKIDNIRHSHSVSFCAVGRTEVLSSQFTARYESVIVSGTAECIEDADQKTLQESLDVL